MRNRQIVATTVLAIALLFPVLSLAQSLSFKEINARVSEYKVWLDKLGSNGSHYWLRLDGTKRPHRLYVGEGFIQATTGEKEEFIEIFSRYLAGHPEKNMLIDIYDGSTGKVIGEYGFGGFRLYTVTVPTTR
jgi:hypothetical protein